MSNETVTRQTVATPVADLFGIDAPKKVTADKFADDQNHQIPRQDEHYVFRKEFVREVLAYIQKPHNDAMLAFGHTGTGKSSGFNQLLARLNYPTEEVTCFEDMRYTDLVGQFVMRAERPGEQPQMTWVDGPLTRAARYGHALILNEWDLMEPGELAGLNDLLDGRPLMISQNGGEIIHPHPDFRLFATGNSAGSGDEMGLYQAVKTQNLAAMDRYRIIEVDYPAPEVEEGILARVAPKLHEDLRKGMVKVANEIRAVFKGENPEAQIGITMSTRVLRRWAMLTLDFKGAKNSSAYALDIALLRRADKEEREAVTRICKDVFGELWG
ncbi:AAA family ATPase [Marinobacter salicampi]|uniref:AAA family ATPase n=1 Tax=Marinobacter salicampi TaxID=435907 RepID=UPI0014099C42|nr:AAA family ATPase [Marinobacter salicampi]